MMGQNPKSEYRNSKQIRKKQIPMTNTKEEQNRPWFVLNFEHSDFGIVSDFVLRISDLKLLFGFPRLSHCTLKWRCGDHF